MDEEEMKLFNQKIEWWYEIKKEEEKNLNSRLRKTIHIVVERQFERERVAG